MNYHPTTRTLCASALLLAILPTASAQEGSAGQPNRMPRVRIAVSVDWEGREISPVNLRAFEALRKALPGVPLTHFLNAAYFTKADANGNELTASIRRVVRDGDEVGLHIHPWRSLVESAGVEFRSKPTVWGPQARRRNRPESGHAVVIESYDVAELRALVRHSKKLLAEHGYPTGTSFRAGAWLAGPNVREAIRREGFLVDSSATDTVWHEELERFALPAMIEKTWPEVTPESQPFWVDTPAGPLLEMPDTCALADYVTDKEMSDHVAAAVSRLKKGGPDLFAHIGFHQETAARFAARVTKAIQTIRTKHDDRVVFETLRDSAARARALIPPPKSSSKPKK